MRCFMTGRTLLLRAVAAVAAGLASQVVHAEMPSPILAMATGQAADQWLVAIPASSGPSIGEEAKAARPAPAEEPSLSLMPDSKLTYPQELSLGEGETPASESGSGRRRLATTYNPFQM